MIWNELGNWCHLVGDSCDVKDRGDLTVVDTRPGMYDVLLVSLHSEMIYISPVVTFD